MAAAATGSYRATLFALALPKEPLRRVVEAAAAEQLAPACARAVLAPKRGDRHSARTGRSNHFGSILEHEIKQDIGVRLKTKNGQKIFAGSEVAEDVAARPALLGVFTCDKNLSKACAVH